RPIAGVPIGREYQRNEIVRVSASQPPVLFTATRVICKLQCEGLDMSPEEYLAIPYVLVVESVEGPDGQWFRRAMYPELGISGEALSPLDAIAKLEEARVATILGKLERGEPVPVPRPPLREEIGGLDAQKLGFAKWLVDQRRVAENDE